MRSLYTLLLTLALPLLILRLVWRSRRTPAYRQRLAERFGRFPRPPQPTPIWIHAVSVGESLAIAPLVRRLLREQPELPICLTTTTPTGSEQVRRLFGDRVFHVYFPYDLPYCLNRFVDRIQPRLLIMVETEIWPNLLRRTRQLGITSILANARLSRRSAQRYARFSGFTRQVFSWIDQIAAQTPEDAERFRALGVPETRIAVTGSIKFDVALSASLRERAEVIKRSWSGRPTWVAASTHEGEEELVLDAHRRLLDRSPQTLLVLAPRHPERFDKVAELVERQGLRLARRTSSEAPQNEIEVMLCDTMGELPAILSAADAAFVGGSLVDRGGHNLLEPASAGVPVCFGPHVFNFAAIARLLLLRGAGRQVASVTELSDCIAEWLLDANMRSTVGQRGQAVVVENRGALDRLWSLISQHLPQTDRQ